MAKLLVAALGEEQDFDSFFMVRSRQIRDFRDRAGRYLVLQLGDRSGEIEAKVWDDAEQWHQQLRPETVVKVRGRTQVYNGRLEIKVARLRLAHDDEYALEDFLPASGRDRAEMLAELRAIISAVGTPYLAALLGAIFDEQTLLDFATAPAAKLIHHAYLGGLIQHTLEVVQFCRAALDIYPQVDRELLITGALLHDIGKLREYSFQRSIDFSDEGRLIGHVVLGEELVVAEARRIDGFPAGLLVRLRHMLISHHGQYEWQAPKRPKTIEACILHLADYFSGQVAIFDAALKASSDPDASWTEYNRFLDRALYIGRASPLPAASDDADTVRRVFEERYQGY